MSLAPIQCMGHAARHLVERRDEGGQAERIHGAIEDETALHAGDDAVDDDGAGGWR